MTETFQFGTRDEIIKFDVMLRDYLKENGRMALPYYSLVIPYDKLERKIFYSYFDIIINIVLLDCDLFDSAIIWNRKFSSKNLETKSVFDSKETFLGKLDMHRFQSSFIFRYRAIWDKIMGFLIYMFDPNEYVNFYKEDGSRKKRFKKVMQKHSNT
jgi:hypothetical protein